MEVHRRPCDTVELRLEERRLTEFELNVRDRCFPPSQHNQNQVLALAHARPLPGKGHVGPEDPKASRLINSCRFKYPHLSMPIHPVCSEEGAIKTTTNASPIFTFRYSDILELLRSPDWILCHDSSVSSAVSVFCQVWRPK